MQVRSDGEYSEPGEVDRGTSNYFVKG